jgi:hypothetical protein
MTHLLKPPDPPEREGGDGEVPPEDSEDPRTHGQRRGKRRSAIPSIDEILEMLFKLNGLVLTGAIWPDHANVIHRNLRTILETQLKRQKGGQQGQVQAGLVDLCRKDPRVLNLLEPFLSEEQFNCLLDEIKDDLHGQA